MAMLIKQRRVTFLGKYSAPTKYLVPGTRLIDRARAAFQAVTGSPGDRNKPETNQGFVSSDIYHGTTIVDHHSSERGGGTNTLESDASMTTTPQPT